MRKMFLTGIKIGSLIGLNSIKRYQVVSESIESYQEVLDSMGKKYYSAQEVAKELGISKQTLIRYEKKGIFPKPKRNLLNKWREYTAGDLAKLREILGRA